MGFDEKKKSCIEKININDRSKKGSIDSDIVNLIKKINNHPNFYTTSSCSGRIVLINHKGEKKNEKEWLLADHFTIDKRKFDKALSSVNKKEVWFMQESCILHICARDIDAANEFLEIAHKAGFKRTGIISLRPRFIIEILGSEKMETIVYKDKMLIDDNYAEILIEEANKKMLSSKQRLTRLENEIDSI